MSSATSTEDHSLHPAAPPARAEDPGLHPWQFFLLAGMLSATGVVLVATGQSPASIIVLSLTVIAASLVALATYRAFAPLVVPKSPETAPVVGALARAALEREKTLVLRSLKDLEFDFAMKKIAKNDFDELSVRLRARAIGLMRRLDEGSGYRAEIERQVLQRLGSTGATELSPAAAQGDAVGAPGAVTDDEATGSNPGDRSLTTCSCGTLNDPDARFCKSCGNKLAVA